MPIQDVDEVANYTDMIGAASALNMSASTKGAWKQSPTKSLVVLWVVVLVLYWLLGYFFRSHLA